ncbi:MAG: hypothetical protein HWE08_14455 [Alphaproteobacteria bacterium]|nr:hypothetical protein [Alphaproteobacteria bacterium]
MRLVILALGWLLLCGIAFPAGQAFATAEVQPIKLTDGWRLFQGEVLDPREASARYENGVSVSVPHVWPEGFGSGPDGTYAVATYVRRINLDQSALEYALRAGKLRSVSRFYAVVGGKASGEATVYDLGGNGTPGVNAESSAAGRLFLADLPFDAREFDLVVQVSNHIYPHAGFLWAPEIGDHRALESAHEIHIVAAFGFTGILIALGAITMLLATWHAGARYYYIGGGMLFVLAIRTLMTDNYIWVLFPGLPLEVALRIEYVGLFVLAPGYYWLVDELFPKESYRQVLIALGGLAAVASALAVVAPIPMMFKMRDPYIAMSAVVLALILYIFIKAKKNHRHGANWALWGIAFAFTGTALDVYLYLPGPRTSIEAIPFAALAFTVLLLGLFTIRYRKEQEEKAFLASCLEKANTELQAHADRIDQAQEEIAAALDMKNSFLSNISREIQTPLKAVEGFAQMLVDPSNTSVTPEQRREYLRLIYSNSANLSKMMEDILSVADLETGRFEVSPQDTDPRKMADQALAVVETVAHEKHLLIDLKCEKTAMVIDQRLMRQALVKILSNAVKFSPVNGVVTVRGSKAGDDFVFTIMDTGPGMEASDIPVAMSLFNKFSHEDGKQDEGAGLGLPLVARFMELLGGGMQIDSIPGLGTTVTLSFPLHAAKE